MRTDNKTRKYRVYGHYKPSGEIFYVGVASDKYRPTKTQNRNTFWWNVVNKHNDWYHEILMEGLTESEANELEIFLIKSIGKRIDGEGTLVNISDGGDGNSRPMMESTKNKLRSYWKQYYIDNPTTKKQKPKGTWDRLKRRISIDGVEYLGVRAAARTTGIPYQTILHRLSNDKMDTYYRL